MTPCISAIPGVKRLSMAVAPYLLTQEWLIAIAVGYVRSSVVANHSSARCGDCPYVSRS